MAKCEVCKKEYDKAEVKRIYGTLPALFCSPQCYTKKVLAVQEQISNEEKK